MRVVNTAARLQSHAEPGQILLSAEVRSAAASSIAAARPITLELNGKAEPLAAYVMDAA